VGFFLGFGVETARVYLLLDSTDCVDLSWEKGRDALWWMFQDPATTLSAREPC
jgi:hypothetical protein